MSASRHDTKIKCFQSGAGTAIGIYSQIAGAIIELTPVNINYSFAIDIISEVESERKEGCSRVCDLLALNPTSKIGRILIKKDDGTRHKQLIALFREVLQIVESHKVRWTITDWPFENFWGNPSEPSHSKLLGYFIDPKKRHGCDNFLRLKFLEVLKDSFGTGGVDFPHDNCEVRAESGYIDLCIKGGCDDRKFAIIIENKINGAKNQDEQLKRYVEFLHAEGLKYCQIYVFYLPFTTDKNPDPSDLDWLVKNRVKYQKITFRKHILDWLATVLKEWPYPSDDRMREHLSYYRNLIEYLDKKRKESEMNEMILAKLKAAEESDTLPSLADVEGLKQSLDSLRQCMEQVLRGRLLLEIHKILQRERYDVWLSPEDLTRKINVNDPYDPRFGENVYVCVRADSANVCFGGGPSKFWIGYGTDGVDRRKEIGVAIFAEAKEHLDTEKPEHYPWYTFIEKPVACGENFSDESLSVAETLKALHKSLIERLKRPVIKTV